MFGYQGDNGVEAVQELGFTEMAIVVGGLNGTQ